MSHVQSIFLSACFLWLDSDFSLKGSIFLHAVYLFFLSLPSLIAWLFSAVSWFTSFSSLDSCISCLPHSAFGCTNIFKTHLPTFFKNKSAKKYCYMKLKSFFIYTLFHFYDCIQLFIYYFMHIILFKVYSTIVNLSVYNFLKLSTTFHEFKISLVHLQKSVILWQGCDVFTFLHVLILTGEDIL